MNAQKMIQHDLFGGPALVLEPRNRQMTEEAAKRFRELSKPDMIRVTPSTVYAPAAYVPKQGGNVPKLQVGKFAPQADGTYNFVPVGGRWYRLCSELCSILGLRDMNRNRKYETMMRLSRAGHIELVKISPGCWLLDLDSWFRHLSECMENPQMWDEGSEERENYLHVNDLGGWQKKQKAKSSSRNKRKG